jgi:hypothetical protein
VPQVPIDSSNAVNSRAKNKNSVRSDVSSMLKSLSDAPTNLSMPENNSLIIELQKYDASIYFSTDENLILKYGPLLFFKENEKDFPILSEIAKMIFCLVPSSSPVESVLSITGNTQNKIRNRLNPNQLANLTLLKKRNFF